MDKHVDVIYASPKSDVYSIAYENGQKEVFRANDDIFESLIDGQMTYNSWRGDVSINGVRIDASRYLSPEDYRRYKIYHLKITVDTNLDAYLRPQAPL